MNAKMVSGVIIGAAFLALFVISVLPGTIPWPAPGPVIGNVGIVKWEDRTLEVLFQGLILFSGVIAILLLLGKRGSKRTSP
jgi:hypothetical protein